jgi:hypothetical protein
MEVVTGFSFKRILKDNKNWNRFVNRVSNLRDAIFENIVKVLVCRTPILGGHTLVCEHCGIEKIIPHSCKSRACSSCGKKLTDQWIQKSQDILPKTKWQHITFTMPDKLWEFFWYNRELFNLIAPMPAEILTKMAKKKGIIPGIFMAIHTFGRDLKRNVHFHVSITLGGLSLSKDRWIGTLYIHHAPLKTQWRYHVVNAFRNAYKEGNLVLPKSLTHIKTYTEFNAWLDKLYQKNWVVHLGPPQNDHQRNIEYLGRYLKRPPLSETNIKNYDGETVTFAYHDHHQGTTNHMKLPVLDFIGRVVQHIPDKYFRMVRYYNWLSNRTRGQLLPLVNSLLEKLGRFYDEAIEPTLPVKVTWQSLMIKTFGVDPMECSICHQTMVIMNMINPAPIEFIMFLYRKNPNDFC